MCTNTWWEALQSMEPDRFVKAQKTQKFKRYTHLWVCHAVFHWLEWLPINWLKTSFTSALLTDVTINSEIQFGWKGEGRAVFALCFCSIQHMLGGSGSKLCDTNQSQQGEHREGKTLLWSQLKESSVEPERDEWEQSPLHSLSQP